MSYDSSPSRCPSCRTGDVISITMSVSEADLQFSTCHECEAKWWVKDGRAVALSSVLGTVGTR